MAADPQASKKEIEKKIIQLALGDELASMKLFDIQSYGGILENEKDAAKRTRIIEEAAQKRAKFIVNSIFITGRRAELVKKIATELNITENRVATLFKELSDSKRIAYLFELTAEITLESITRKENILEIERLQLFLRFLEDFILYYPYPSYYNAEMLTNISLESSGEENIRQIGKEFAEIYTQSHLFKDQIESFLSKQDQSIEAIFSKYEEEIKKLSKEQTGDIEKILEAQQAEIEALQAAQKKDRDVFLIAKFSEFHTYIEEIKVHSLTGTHEGRSLIGQLDAMKKKLKQIESRLALLKEKEEAELPIEDKETEVLSIDKEQIEKERQRLDKEKALTEKERKKIEEERQKLGEERKLTEEEKKKIEEERRKLDEEKKLTEEERKKAKEEGLGAEEIKRQAATILAKDKEISFEEALSQVEELFEKAEEELRGETKGEAEEEAEKGAVIGNLKSKFLEEIKKAALRKVAQKLSPSAEVALNAIGSPTSIAEEAAQKRSEGLTQVQVGIIPKATAYMPQNSKDNHLAESETLYVFSVMPKEEELEKLDSGYILIGRRNPRIAGLYYLEKTEEGLYILVECERGKQELLCKHVSESLGEAKMRLELTQEQQQKLNIPPCGNEDSPAEEKESVVLHILNVLPAKKALDSFDNGYILIGHENPAKAKLYYLSGDKGNKSAKLLEGDLTLLCQCVYEYEEIQLGRKQHRDFIITPGGGHNPKAAKTATLAAAASSQLAALPSLPQQPPTSVSVAHSSSSSSSSSSSKASENESSLKRNTIVLLKSNQDWPTYSKIMNDAYYFKWNESGKELAVKYKQSDGKMVPFERVILNPRNINLVTEEFKRFEQSENTESFQVTEEARKFLIFFVENPNPEISRRMSVALPRQKPSQQSDVLLPSVSEKGKEKMNDGRGSPKEGEKLSSSPKASFYAPAEAPQPTSTDAKIEEDVNPPVKKVGLNNSQ